MTSVRALPDARGMWRIGDAAGAYPVWSVEGGRRFSGRWHDAGQSIVYAARNYSLALLEKLVHAGNVMPPTQHAVLLEMPAGLPYEVVNRDALPGWNDERGDAARVFGSRWYAERRSAVLFVPSVIAPMEQNVVVNGEHPDFGRIVPSLEIPVHWDSRLFGCLAH